MFLAPSALPRAGIKRAFFTLSFTLAAAFQAAPAMAQGVPQPGIVEWIDDFSAGAPLPGTTPVPIENYHDPNGVPYTVGTGWDSGANECNGWILNSGTNMPPADVGCNTNAGRTGGAGTPAPTAIAWNFLKAIATVLGQYQGMPTIDATNNNVLASMTTPALGAAAVIPSTLQIQADSVVSVTAGHYYIATTDFAEIHCNKDTYKPAGVTWNDAAETIFLLNGATQATLVQSPVTNPCDNAPYTTTAAGTPVYVTTGSTSAWLAASGISTVGIKITNDTTDTTGNDVAIDNLQIIDVTPQLSESFGPASIPVGGTSTLTFTITNTNDLLAKDGWSITEALPAGLTMVGTPTTTCPGGVVTPAGTGGFTVTANLEDANTDASKASCTVTVVVTAATAGTYTNDVVTTPGGRGISGLNGLLTPNSTQLVVAGGLNAAAAVPTGKELSWLLLLLLTAAAWPALVKRAKR